MFSCIRFLASGICTASPAFVILLKTMKITLAAFFLAFATIVLLAGDYQIKTVQVSPVESYPARTEMGGVAIAADPYFNDAKSFTAFDVKNLNTRGYFPVHVIIRNGSTNFLNIRTRNIVLITSSGQQLYTTPATVVVEDVIKAGLISKLPKMKSRDQTTSMKVGSPLSDFTSKEFTNRLIDPETATDGFLFFFTTTPKDDFFAGSSLYIPKLEEEGTRKAIGPFAIPLDPALKK
jgi:hypothetical protein